MHAHRPPSGHLRLGVTTSLLIVLLAVGAPPVRGGEAEGEPPPALDVGALLAPDVRKGPHHEVLDDVETRGFLARFRMTSPFGEYQVTSRRLLEIRAHEVETLARVTHMKGAPEGLRALGRSLAELPTAAVDLVLHPVDSAKRMGRGVGKTFRRLGDAFGGRRRSRYEDPSGETAFTGDSKRQLADALNLDVYSTNPQVQAFLDRIGRARAAGTLSVDVASLALPVVGFVAVTITGWQADVRRLLRDQTPAELERRNAQTLGRLGIPTPAIRAFLAHAALSPRHETVIAHAAAQLEGAEGRIALLDAARTAVDEVGALYHEQQAVLLTAGEHGRIVRLERVFHVVLARTQDERVLAYLPYDTVYATPEWSRLLDALARAEIAKTAARRTLHVTGSVSEAARDAARGRGFDVEPVPRPFPRTRSD